jgi:polar amino acid transport system permease protein
MTGVDRFLFTFFNAEVAAAYLPDILAGMAVTLAVGVAVIATGLVLGVVLVMLRTLGHPLLSLPIIAFVDIMRALPPLVMMILLFFAFPLIGFAMSAFAAVWLTLSLVLAAYAEECLWGGILALPGGQWEAARSTGLTWLQTMSAVILPQAFRIALPPLTNRIITITKNAALGSVVGLNEILNNAQSASSLAGNPTPLMLGAAAYLIIFVPVILAARQIEARMARGAV